MEDSKEEDVVMDLSRARVELRQALGPLSRRGLAVSAKWAAELMMATEASSTTTGSEAVALPYADEEVEDGVLLAKTYFDVKEYKRAAHCLESLSCSTPLAIFLRLFATYLDGEKTREEAAFEQKPAPKPQYHQPQRRPQDTDDRLHLLNKELLKLDQELTELEEKGFNDAFCLYLHGVVMRDLDNHDQAISLLVRSVNAFPWNWSAWKALTSLCKDRERVVGLQLVPHWMQKFFLVDVFLELQGNDADEVMGLLAHLQELFPSSTHVTAQLARAHYHRRDFNSAEPLFEDLRAMDPYRLEDMDVYSNILYVKDSRGTLSYLAHQAVRVDKYRPETCCIVGNYYSIKSEHEKAVLYFKRALRLDPNYLSAWTLMGHEFVEMKRSSAAIEAYRRAVDVNPNDFRAWYGLGQAYEMMQMPQYSLYYFRKAKDLRPYDARMWCAMGETFEKLNRVEDAIKCYRRAVVNDDQEGLSLVKLAKLHNGLRNQSKAAYWYRQVLERRENDTGQDTLEALHFLAEFCKNQKQFEEAEKYCSRLLDIGGHNKTQAKSLLIEIRQLASSYRAAAQEPPKQPWQT